MRKRKLILKTGVVLLFLAVSVQAVTVDINTTPAGRKQLIDGFGAHQGNNLTSQAWWQNLFFDDMRCSIYRVDLTPKFKSPYSDWNYNCPWFHNNPALPGPENNNCRTYTDANNYTHTASVWGRETPIAVMGPDINNNINYFDYSDTSDGIIAQLGNSKKSQLGDFKLIGSLWSPAPWVKLASGHTYNDTYWWPGPFTGTKWPFIWAGNFAGGKLDISNTPLAIFDDGTGPTSAITQFARCTAAYIRGFQNTFGVHFYAISIQNEINFEEFYNSCTYQLSSQYITALKAIRAEFDKYPDLTNIKIKGPEDLMGGDVWGMWQYGGGSDTTHKNLQYLQNINADPCAAAAIAFFCIHGYASDGVSSAGASSTLWNWWANGWTSSPAGGIPSNVHGFTWYGKKSWMTETSGENAAWLWPAEPSYPNNGGWSIALKIHQALNAGMESAWIYWTFGEENNGQPTPAALTGPTLLANSPKYVAAKHFFRFIRPNSYRYTTTVTGDPNILAGAYVHDSDKSLTIVLINCSGSAQSATINIPGNPANITSFDCYMSSSGSYWNKTQVETSASQVTISIPQYGIVTLYGEAPCARSDFLRDGTVNFQDFATFANQWGTSPGNPSADIAPLPDGDGVIDFNDMKSFSNCWLIS
jgi:O-glycosyl hydrolase